MGTEIERKWLVASDPPHERVDAGVPLRQGYLAREGDVEVRVRLTPVSATLTVKGGRGLQRTEVELPIAPDEAEALWLLTEGRRLEKVRHRVEVGGLWAELDVYGGRLAGLRVVEVEFASTAAAAAFVAPPWFGEEVTGSARWTNASLAEGRAHP